MKCLQCKSERIVKNVRVVDRGNNNYRRDLKLEVYESPDNIFFRGEHEAVLKANVCAKCGFVMFTVSIEEATELERHKTDSRFSSQ